MLNTKNIQITDEEFELIANLVHTKFGIFLGKHKRDLVIARLRQILVAGQFENFKEYYDYVVKEHTGRALLMLVDRISTNHTYFFRETAHFDFFLQNVVGPWPAGPANQGEQDTRVWCAGCASGEEPYTLAMLLQERPGGAAVAILATDISVSALAEARAGVYPQERLAATPAAYRLKYFSRLADGRWAIAENLKKKVLFRRMNLVRPDYPFKNRFQAIICRNVMIYFDAPTRQAVIERFHRFTEPGGYLMVGHSESVDRSLGLYRYLEPSIYQKA